MVCVDMCRYGYRVVRTQAGGGGAAVCHPHTTRRLIRVTLYLAQLGRGMGSLCTSAHTSRATVLSGSVSVDNTRTISMSWYFHNNVRIFYVRTFFSGPRSRVSRLPAVLSMVSRRKEKPPSPGPRPACGAAVAVLMEILKYCGGHKSVNNHHYC